MTCWFGHEWYVPFPYFATYGEGSNTCGTFYKTGPLPDDEHWPDFYSGVVYRRERSCKHCDYTEYWNTRKKDWVAIDFKKYKYKIGEQT